MDDELIEKAKKGSKRSFMKLAEELKLQMYKTAFVQLRNEQDALDAVQEALIKAFQNIKNLKQNQFFKSWILRILLNECHNIQRYNKKVVLMERESMVQKEYSMQCSFETVEIYSVLCRMEDIYKEVINLRYNHDLKLEEISKVLDVPVGTVKSRLNRAHAVFKQQFLKEEALS